MLTVSGSMNPRAVMTGLTTPSERVALIDLREVTFVEPSGLVAVAAVADRARQNALTVQFSPPEAPAVRNYLSRMGLPEFFDDMGVQHGLPSVHKNPLESELLELQPFTGQRGGEELAALVHEKVSGAGVDPQVVDTLYESICELASNATTHSGQDKGFVAAQTTHGGQRITFAVADCGRGIRNSLGSHYTIDTDAAALDLAVLRNFSGTGETGRGQGLSEVLESTKGLKGTLHIASGTALATHRGGQTATPPAFSSGFPGTLIQVELPCRP